MKRLTSIVRVGQFEFYHPAEVSIWSSWKTLTDTCMITLPRRLKWKDQYIKDVIRPGDGVEVLLGYDFEEELAFTGSVVRVRNTVPVQLECEDGMFQLKQIQVNKSWRKVSLPDMLRDVLPEGFRFNALTADLGAFRASQVTVAQLLEELRKQYGFVSFFRDDQLVVGWPYSGNRDTYSIVYENSVVNDLRLEWQEQGSIKLRVKAISIQRNGTQIVEEFGPLDGEQRTLHFYNLNRAELRQVAQEELKRLDYSGFRGNFVMFGQPPVRHSDAVSLNSLLYPERNGTYLVDEVHTTFSPAGFRRDIKIGPAL